MKKQADKKHTDREFAVGDVVFLKLQPFIQTSVAQRPFQKLSFRYYGPYKVMERVGKVAYKLQLTSESKIHSVVHVSQLKKAVGDNILVEAELPPAAVILRIEQLPTAILAEKTIKTA